MQGGMHLVQIGTQASLAGGEVAATSVLRMKGWIDESDTETEYPPEAIGIISGQGRHAIKKKSATLALEETPVTFEQLPIFLDGALEAETATQDGAGTDYIWLYTLPYSTATSPGTNSFYTVEVGDEQQARIMTGCFTESLTITGAGEAGWMYTPVLRGRPGGNTTFTGAVSIPTVEDVIFSRTKLYIDDVGTGFGSTLVSEPFLEFELTWENIRRAIWAGAGLDQPYYSHVHYTGADQLSLTFTLSHESVAAAEIAVRDDTDLIGKPRAIRLVAEGETVATPGTTYSKKTIIIDLAGTFNEAGEFSEDDGLVQYNFNFMNHYDATLGERGSITVVNELSALP